MNIVIGNQRSRDYSRSQRGDVFLERIPEDIYKDLVLELTTRYGFANGLESGGRMRLSEYYLGIPRSTANEVLGFVQQILHNAKEYRFPPSPLPEGFDLPETGLLPLERQGGFSFGHFDAAVTEDGPRVIEVQGLPTYHMTAAFAGRFLRDRLDTGEFSVTVNGPDVGWEQLVKLKQTILAGGVADGIVLMDRCLASQKTIFDFKLTQRELGLDMDIVDIQDIFERDGGLFYRAGREEKRVQRLYNRVLAFEAIEDDGYPHNADQWRFRFDRSYDGLTFVNHPARSFSCSKHVLPYVSHPINPECYELAHIARDFKAGNLRYADFVWKHKQGVAGRGSLLLPNADILGELIRSDSLNSYISQRRVSFEEFETGDGQTKIVEIRFMSVQSLDQMLVVPMARIGHVEKTRNGERIYRIHFGDNNNPGYGFCPVLIVE